MRRSFFMGLFPLTCCVLVSCGDGKSWDDLIPVEREKGNVFAPALAFREVWQPISINCGVFGQNVYDPNTDANLRLEENYLVWSELSERSPTRLCRRGLVYSRVTTHSGMQEDEEMGTTLIERASLASETEKVQCWNVKEDVAIGAPIETSISETRSIDGIIALSKTRSQLQITFKPWRGCDGGQAHIMARLNRVYENSPIE